MKVTFRLWGKRITRFQQEMMLFSNTNSIPQYLQDLVHRRLAPDQYEYAQLNTPIRQRSHNNDNNDNTDAASRESRRAALLLFLLLLEERARVLL